MKLLLTSGGITNSSLEESLLSLTGRPFNELNLAFIPTASNVEKGDKGWLIKDLVKCQELGFKQVDIVDISAVPKDVWLKRLEYADVIFVEGGNTFHLMYWMEKSGLKDELTKLLPSRVYVGVSAGSMVACRSLDLSQSKRLYSEEIGEQASDDGLGYVDTLLRPHLNSPYFPNVNLDNLEKIASERPDEFYALDDNSALLIDGERVEVISEGIWKKFN